MLRKVNLNRCAEIIGRGISPKYSNAGIFDVLNQRCIRDGRILFENKRQHDGSAKAVPERKILKPGDILVNSTGVGTVGRVARFDSPETNVTVDSHVTIVRPHNGIHSEWLFYALRHQESVIASLAHGSTGQVELSKTRLEALKLPKFDLIDQRRIAGLLGALDDKIESNRVQQRTGQNLMRSLFEHSHQAAEDSLTVGDYVQLVNTTVKPVDIPTDCAYVSLSNVNKNDLFSVSFSSADEIASSKNAFLKGDILFGKLRPYFNKVCICPCDGVASTDILVLRAEQRIYALIAALVISSQNVIDAVSSAAGGTRMPRTSWADLKRQPAPLFSAKQVTLLTNLLVPIEEHMLRLSKQNALLTELRDTLLPELMSGRMHVDEARGLVMEALDAGEQHEQAVS